MKTKPTPTLAAVVQPRLVRFVAYVAQSHKFFIRESYPYSGTAFIRHPFKWLRAYCRFMWSSTKDGFHQANESGEGRRTATSEFTNQPL